MLRNELEFLHGMSIKYFMEQNKDQTIATWYYTKRAKYFSTLMLLWQSNSLYFITFGQVL